MDFRTRARELAMQCLFQLDVQGSDVLLQIADFLEENEPDTQSRKIAYEWAKKTWQNLESCDELISDAMIKWRLSRLAPVDRSILRLSVYQFLYCSEIPPRVVINEAVELAKKFGSDKSFAFVNGVLDAVLKKIESRKF